MRKLFGAAIAVLIASALVATPIASATPSRSRVLPERSSLTGYLPPAVPGEVIVRFHQPISRSTTARTVSALGGSIVAGPVGKLSVVRTAVGTTVAELITSLGSHPLVAYAEPNYLRYLSVTPNDPRFSDQWGINNSAQSHAISSSNATRVGTADADMDVAEAWDTQQGSSETIVAIMDSGVEVDHPDLAANIWINDGEIAGNGVDDDGNGYTDDINGWDFADNDASLIQSAGRYEGWDHGTHVAGIVGAVANNGIGVAGVCSSCKLMVLKVFKPFDTDSNGVLDTMVGDVAGELKAFDYAIKMGADVINGSFSGSIVSTRSERAKIKEGIAAGITMVFAAGNENGDNDLLIPGLDFDGDQVSDMTSPAYPASYDLPGSISVAASNDSDQNAVHSACVLALGSNEWPCTFTNWGHDSVDVYAPGVDVVSTLPNKGYGMFDGTSMAAPNVAGVAGLVKAEHPGYTPRQVANAIMNSVDKAAPLQRLFAVPEEDLSGDFTRTAGRVNAASALNAPTANGYPTTDGNIAGAVSLIGTATNTVSWPEDVNDVFKKKLIKGKTYRAALNTLGAHDLDLQIYKPAAREIWQFDNRCFGSQLGCPVFFYEPNESGDVSFRFRAPRGGIFYFHVNAWLLDGAAYTLKVTRV